jgi:hypothetical protein
MGSLQEISGISPDAFEAALRQAPFADGCPPP